MRFLGWLGIAFVLMGTQCPITEADYKISLEGGHAVAGPMLWDGEEILGAEVEFFSYIGEFFPHRVNAIIPRWFMEPESTACWEVLTASLPGSEPADGVWDGAAMQLYQGGDGNLWPVWWTYAKRDRLRLLGGTRISWGRAVVRFRDEVAGCEEDPGANFHPWTLLWYDSRYPEAGETNHVCSWGLHRVGDNPDTFCVVKQDGAFVHSPAFERLFIVEGSHFHVSPPVGR